MTGKRKFQDVKLLLPSKDISRRVQERLFKEGYTWPSGGKKVIFKTENNEVLWITTESQHMFCGHAGDTTRIGYDLARGREIHYSEITEIMFDGDGNIW